MVLPKAKIRDEAELESLLVSNPNQIEDGFVVLTHQRKTSELKSMDILGVDSEGTLTLIELKVKSEANQLRQAIQYYDWILQQGIDWVVDAYKDRLGDRRLAERMPQILLIAPDFEPEMITESKYFIEDMNIRLLKYKAYEVDNKKEVELDEVPIPPVKEIGEKPWTVQDNIDWVIDKHAKESFAYVAKVLRELPDVDEKPANWKIGYWIRGRRFCSLHPHRKFFHLGYKTDENERGYDRLTNIVNKEQVDQVLPKLKKAYELMKEK